MTINSLAFKEMAESCRDNPMASSKGKKLMLSGKLHSKPIINNISFKIFFVIKSDDIDDINDSSSSVYCHPINFSDFDNIDIGSRISITGILDFDSNNCGSSDGIYVRLTNCTIINEEEAK